jgi:hypothetical protein
MRFRRAQFSSQAFAAVLIITSPIDKLRPELIANVWDGTMVLAVPGSLLIVRGRSIAGKTTVHLGNARLTEDRWSRRSCLAGFAVSRHQRDDHRRAERSADLHDTHPLN